MTTRACFSMHVVFMNKQHQSRPWWHIEIKNIAQQIIYLQLRKAFLIAIVKQYYKILPLFELL